MHTRGRNFKPARLRAPATHARQKPQNRQDAGCLPLHTTSKDTMTDLRSSRQDPRLFQIAPAEGQRRTMPGIEDSQFGQNPVR
ncbi:hypothetical protein NDU88_010638 [Pleurodeles waltl]|uniref:Uncharacterized protein n=1 Tax=Pleurodeles waltl TaxID=8319 RepID=A0AAV7PVG8_PLEWA|nr:hypothetical protein NDU88_010638 [Pleurodeles waltl]